MKFGSAIKKIVHQHDHQTAKRFSPRSVFVIGGGGRAQQYLHMAWRDIKRAAPKKTIDDTMRRRRWWFLCAIVSCYISTIFLCHTSINNWTRILVKVPLRRCSSSRDRLHLRHRDLIRPSLCSRSHHLICQAFCSDRILSSFSNCLYVCLFGGSDFTIAIPQKTLTLRTLWKLFSILQIRITLRPPVFLIRKRWKFHRQNQLTKNNMLMRLVIYLHTIPIIIHRKAHGPSIFSWVILCGGVVSKLGISHTKRDV